MREIVTVAVIIGLGFLIGCSSDDSSNAAPSDAGDASAALSGNNCVAPGTAANENGIGAYCSPKGGQCDKVGPGGAPRICTADLPDTPGNAWFCTFPCAEDKECGAGAVCHHEDRGSGCIPIACKALAGDAGRD